MMVRFGQNAYLWGQRVRSRQNMINPSIYFFPCITDIISDSFRTKTARHVLCKKVVHIDLSARDPWAGPGPIILVCS